MKVPPPPLSVDVINGSPVMHLVTAGIRQRESVSRRAGVTETLAGDLQMRHSK